MTRSTVWLNVTLISVLLLSVWLMLRYSAIKNADSEQSINGFVTNLTFTQYNAQGDIQNTLITNEARHSLEKDNFYFDHPHLQAISDDHIPWIIQADHGVSLNHNTLIKLWGNVSLHQLPSKNHAETLILTQSLIYYPKTSNARGNEAVEIKQPNSHLSGIGFRANFKKGLFQIMSQSRGFYVPENP